MSVKISIDVNHPDLGPGHVDLVCTATPYDIFVPMALAKLGKDDQKMQELFVQILNSMDLPMDEEGDDEPQDEGR